MFHNVNVSRSGSPIKELFIANSSADITSGDSRLYNIGVFQCATTGMQSNRAILGELWIEYDISLKKPRLLPGVVTDDEGTFDQFQIYGGAAGQPNVVPATPFGTNTQTLILPASGSTLGGRLSGGIVVIADQLQNFVIPVLSGTTGYLKPTGETQNSVANSYYFPPGISAGNYLVCYSSLYAVAGTVTSVVIGTINCAHSVNQPSLNLDTVGLIANVSAGAVASLMFSVFVTVTAANAAINFVPTGTATGPTYADVFVMRLPNG